MKFTLNFTEIDKGDTQKAGGKGASLGEMTQAGIPVPEGFVVLSTTFDQFIHETDIVQEIESILSQVNHKAIHTVEEASEKIRGLIEAQAIPQDIASEIEKSFIILKSDYVAVRSSATAEDGLEHAWAGQLETFLNTTKENLLENVKKCWSSLFTPRAIFYRFEKGLHGSGISVAVVVQKMIQSECSGVAFSVHPVTEDRNQILIEAGFGLGEAIVSGTITPDSYVVEKEPRKIVDATINTQTRALFRGKEGGNEWQEIKHGSLPVLSENQILELARLVVEIEGHYGFPSDIEWAYYDKRFYILQARPITTLSRPKSSRSFAGSFPRMIFMGKRRTNLYEASLKVLGRSRVWEKEFGVGFKIVVINSIGESYTDFESKAGVIKMLDEQTVEDAKIYVQKLSDLGGSMMEKIHINSENECLEDFSKMMGYFFYIKSVFEREYNRSNFEDKKFIETWRNDDKIFESLDKYYELYPQKDDVGNGGWSWIYKDDKLSLSHKDLFFPKKETEIIESKIVEFRKHKIIKGNSAFPGVVKGKVRVILKNNDKALFKEGEVIVAPMTTVDFLPIMKGALAFITDEGGITSHAAIVARELKKPCVIGTKIATEVLKTGDFVEVDAGNDVIRILSSRAIAYNPDAYQRLFQVGSMPYIISDIFFTEYRKLDALIIFGRGNWTSYLPKKLIEKTLKEGLEIYSNKEIFNKYKTDFEEYKNKSKKYFEELIIKKSLSKVEMAGFLDLTSKFFFFYRKTEFFATDEAYRYSLKDKQTAENLKQFEHIKNSGREYLNKIFFGDESYLSQVLGIISKQSGVSFEDILAYKKDEILELFDDKKIFQEMLSDRKMSYVMTTSSYLDGKSADDIVSQFHASSHKFHTQIKGVTANKGLVRGRARVITMGYSNFDSLKHIMAKMEKGDVLIAETTSPEFMPACSKASAIVTNQGGMMSHAAIVSREMGIPCIVGTGNATDLIKDGDMLEVNGDAGLVIMLK